MYVREQPENNPFVDFYANFMLFGVVGGLEPGPADTGGEVGCSLNPSNNQTCMHLVLETIQSLEGEARINHSSLYWQLYYSLSYHHKGLSYVKQGIEKMFGRIVTLVWF